MLAMVFGSFKLIVKGNAAATFNNFMANELLIRITSSYELIMYASIVILSVALYAILKTVNRNLALFALCCRLAEVVQECIMVQCSLIILLFLKSENILAVFKPEQLHALVGLFIGISSAATSILMIFISLGTIVFFYLFFKFRCIPRILALFGIVSFSLFLIGSFVGILTAKNALMFFAGPGILFEITIGLWLLIKGVKIPEIKS